MRANAYAAVAAVTSWSTVDATATPRLLAAKRQNGNASTTRR